LNDNKFTSIASSLQDVARLAGATARVFDANGPLANSVNSDETNERVFQIETSPLRVFDISNNNIRGNLPGHWLRAHVIASGNKLYGRFPTRADRFGGLKIDLAGNMIQKPDLSIWMASCKNISVGTVNAETLGEITNRRRATASSSNSHLGYSNSADNATSTMASDKFACACVNCVGMLVVEHADFSPRGNCMMDVSLRCSCQRGYTISPTWSAHRARNQDASCEKCPVGIQCHGGAAPGIVSPGFVMSASGSIQSCPIPQACKGDNQCVDGASGTHCAACASGYLNPMVDQISHSPAGQKMCLECNSTAYYGLLGYGAAFASLFVLWYRGSIHAPPTSEGFMASWHTVQAIGAISLLRQAPQRNGWFHVSLMSAPSAECLFRYGHLTIPAIVPLAGVLLAVVFCARHVSYGTLTFQPWPKFTRKAGKALKLWPLAAAQVWCYCSAPHVIFSIFRMFDCTSGFSPQDLPHDFVLRAAPDVACWSAAHFQFFPLVLLSLAYLGACLWVATFTWREVKIVVEGENGQKTQELVRSAVGRGAVLAPVRMLILCLVVSVAGERWPFVLLISLGAVVYASQPYRIEFLSSCALCAVAGLAIIERLWHHGLSSLMSGTAFAIPILLLEGASMYVLQQSTERVTDMWYKALGYRHTILGTTTTPASCDNTEFSANMPRPQTGGSSSSVPDAVQLSVLPEEQPIDDSEEGFKAAPSKLEITEKRLKDMTKNAQEMRDERDSLVRVV
jgi:hypothetical protein